MKGRGNRLFIKDDSRKASVQVLHVNNGFVA
jgi:hypothetical protein